MDRSRKLVRDMIIKELNLPTDEQQEHIRIELYKKLEEIAFSIKLERDSLILDLSGLNEVLSKYGYRLAHNDVSIPLIKKNSRDSFATPKVSPEALNW